MTAARQGGCKAPGDGAEPRGMQHGPPAPGASRVTHGAHARPAGRPAPLGAQHGRARTLPRAAADTKSEEGRPRPRAGELNRLRPQCGSLPASPTPAPAHSSGEPTPAPHGAEPSLPPPPDRSAAVTIPQNPNAPTGLAAAAAAPSPAAPPPYTGGRAAPMGANRGPGSSS